MDSLDVLSLYYSMGGWFIALAIFFGIIVLAVYAVNAYFVSSALARAGYSNSFWIWIPFLSSYAIADLVKDRGDGLVEIFGYRFEIKLFKFYWLIAIMISGFSVLFLPVGAIVGVLINAICGGMAYNVLYKCYEQVNEDDVVYKVICWASGVIPLIPMIKCIFYRLQQPIQMVGNCTSSSFSFTNPIVDTSGYTGEVTLDMDEPEVKETTTMAEVESIIEEPKSDEVDIFAEETVVTNPLEEKYSSVTSNNSVVDDTTPLF